MPIESDSAVAIHAGGKLPLGVHAAIGDRDRGLVNIDAFYFADFNTKTVFHPDPKYIRIRYRHADRLAFENRSDIVNGNFI